MEYSEAYVSVKFEINTGPYDMTKKKVEGILVHTHVKLCKM